ncbi:MAG: DUF4254 domain-containing protein [Cloacibacterium sp.]|jgi:hypothetical protein|nr:DUF4254 domain-containing protein [Cloacibacterium sp.]MBP8060493.1 DUF4254 domain-containing protein [Cloacibacterium sp.]
MSLSSSAWDIFSKSVEDYHINDNIDFPINNPFEKGSLEQLLYAKNWIDTVQWHLEDIIRDENIDPVDALKLKRRIDASNQQRTDLVEYIDSWFLQKYQNITPKSEAKINTETVAWAIDRLSILVLKVYHMNQEATRESASDEHRAKCTEKLNVLLEQKKDLSQAIDFLLEEIEKGNVKMKTYKQMKMYNDESLNPVLYQKSKN